MTPTIQTLTRLLRAADADTAALGTEAANLRAEAGRAAAKPIDLAPLYAQLGAAEAEAAAGGEDRTEAARQAIREATAAHARAVRQAEQRGREITARLLEIEAELAAIKARRGPIEAAHAAACYEATDAMHQTAVQRYITAADAVARAYCDAIAASEASVRFGGGGLRVTGGLPGAPILALPGFGQNNPVTLGAASAEVAAQRDALINDCYPND
jgi:hypothetical protein